MKYLVDTQAWIGFLEGRKGFGSEARKLMTAHPTQCRISIASIWEAAIKIGIGKLKLPYDLRDDLPRLLEENGFKLLPIRFDEAAAVADLPRHHGDPFDRLMAAQAMANGLKVVSSDEVFDRYGLARIW
ncbi:MAG TPA: type II toxin-antitoxin system VapC family toxin [Luteolibacter sp.]|nr:type II toxin-antitoxin system VapC family toxin [Luteolibacter sp.]